MIKGVTDNWYERLPLPQENKKHIAIFCKLLYLFLLFKIFSLWPSLDDVLVYRPFAYNSFISFCLFAPLAIININPEWFLIGFCLLLVLSIVAPLNYFSTFLVFWFSISLSRLFLPVINGSDLVLNLFLLIAIVFPAYPQLKSKIGVDLQNALAGIALFVGQVQLSLIYLLSGYDKLLSPAWRSGASMDSISNLIFFHNPSIITNLNPIICFILSWLVIVFEISFGFLIWIKRIRVVVLIIGVVFHFVIAIVLGLIDFALVMIICYGVFLPFKKVSPGFQLNNRL